MLDFLKNWVQALVVIILLANFLQILLPGDKFKSYVRLVMGFIILLTLLNPLVHILNRDFVIPDIRDLEGLVLDDDRSEVYLNDIQTQGERIQEVQRAAFLEDYSEGLKKQVRALISLVGDLELRGVKPILSSFDTLKGLELDLVKSGSSQEDKLSKDGGDVVVEPVKSIQVKLTEKDEEKIYRDEQKQSDIVNTVREFISDFYNLNLEDVKVNIR